jgi:hypothetical protein
VRHLRGVLIALAVLALSAGAALAGLPQAAADGLARATHASGKTVPVPATITTEEVDPDVDAPEVVAPDEDTDEDTDQETDEDTDTEAGDHGATVSEAAQGETPEGWANHGAYVSAVARGLAKVGDPAPEGADRAAKVKPAAATAHAKPDKATKPTK